MTFKDDMATDRAVFFNTDDFAETVTYTPADGGEASSPDVIVERLDDARQISGDRTVKRAFLHIQSGDIADPAYGDQVEIDSPDEIEELSTEIMTNGDNEAAKATLDDDDDIFAVSSQSNEQAKFGTYSTKVTLSGATYLGYRQFYTDIIGDLIAEGETYRCSFWAYLPAGQAIDKIKAYSHGGGEESPVRTEITTTADTWVSGTVDITVVDKLDFRVYAEDTELVLNTNFFYVDEISIRKVTTKSSRTWRVIEVPATDEEGVWKLLIEQDLRPVM